MVKKIVDLIKSKFLWVNILVAIFSVVILVSVVLFALKIYTNHGEAIKVPNLVGLYENEAEEAIKHTGLTFEIIDSVYTRDAKPGIIVEQTPNQGLSVKDGRVVYLTINAKQKRAITIPNLINVSQRQATYTLTSLGFNIGNVEIIPSEYTDLVLDIKYNGVSLKEGDKVPDGATLSLSVGRSDSVYNGEMVIVPSLIGLSINEAEKIIANNNLVVGYIGFDNPQPSTDKEKLSYKIYRQMPPVTEQVVPGKRVDLWLSKDPQKLQQSNKKDDDFF
ncbi:MAG: PASTA domain-containing protein [Porphyromonadaceae bacterium]|nr:PASTA domain-containing protein [Porphyromonadaceae bacterium]